MKLRGKRRVSPFLGLAPCPRYAGKLDDHGALCAGDVSWHHGWCLHSAPPNDPWFHCSDDDEDGRICTGSPEHGGGASQSGSKSVRGLPTRRPRLALAVSFIADGARLQGPARTSVAPLGCGAPEVAPAESGAGGGARGAPCGAPSPRAADDRGGSSSQAGVDAGRAIDAGHTEWHAHDPALDDEDRTSYEAWLGDLAPGAAAAHALLPLVWPRA